MSIATIDDFEDRHGELAGADEDIVQNLLDDAGALILQEAGAVDWGLGSGDTAPPRTVVMVCVAAAFRAWRNPAGVRSEQLGQASVSYAVASDGVWLTERERGIVRAAAGRSKHVSATLESPYSGHSSSELDFYPEDL